MSELDRSVRDYLAQVASPTPSATGGNVGAITVAAAAGLVAMTARVSPAITGAEQAAADADDLRSRATELALEDERSYGAVLAAQRRTDPGRAEALREALAAAAQPPLRIADAAAAVAALAARLAATAKRPLRGDAATASALAAAAARSAAALARTDLAAAGAPLAPAEEAERAAEAAQRAADEALATSAGSAASAAADG